MAVVVVLVVAVMTVGRTDDRTTSTTGRSKRAQPSAQPIPVASTVNPVEAPPPTTLPRGSLVPSAWTGSQQLAYVTNGALEVLDGTGSVRPIFSRSPVCCAKWSYDGRWLAFTANDNELWVSTADGSSMWPVGGTAFQWAWSPAADVLAVLREPTAPNGPQPVDLYRPDAPDAPTGAVGDGWQVFDFAWSPDGSRIALVGFPPELVAHHGPTVMRLGFGRADVAEPVQPVEYQSRPGDEAVACLFLAGWAPDGSGVLVWFDPMCSGSVAADGLDLQSIPLAGAVGTTLGDTLVKRAWVVPSASGSLALVAGRGRDINATRSVVRCTSARDCQPVATVGGSTFDPAWSPDGRQIAFVRTDIEPNTLNLPPARIADYERRHLWLAQADGSNAREIGGAGGSVGAPLWLQDGRHILYVRADYLWLLDLVDETAVPVAGPLDAKADVGRPIVAAYEGSDLYGGGWQSLFAVSP